MSAESRSWLVYREGPWLKAFLRGRRAEQAKAKFDPTSLQEFEGATRLGATGLRGSEREICLWEGLWEDLWKTSKNLSKPLKTSENLPLKDPLRDPLRGRFPSQNLSGLIMLPLNLSPTSAPTRVPMRGPMAALTTAPTRIDLPCSRLFEDSPRKLPRNSRRCPRKRPKSVHSSAT